MLTTGQYLVGALFFLATIGAVAAGAVLVMRRRLAHLTGSARVLALALVATTALLAVHVVPAALFVLSRESVLVAAVLWLAATARLRHAVPSTDSPPMPVEPTDRASSVAAGVAAGLLGLYALALACTHVTEPSTAADTVSFHLPGVARWIETGTIWQIDQFLPELSPGNYPNNGDVMLLAGVLPWENDFLAHRAMYPFYGLTLLAVYGIARELAASRAAAAAFAAVLGAIPVVLVPALVSALVDSVMLATFGAGVLFLLRHSRTGATSDLVLAGLGLGIAFGTKWYGVTAAAVVLVTWSVASLLARRSARTVLRQGAGLAGLIVLTGGIWLLRNLILSGNPVFPVEVAAFGITIFDAPHDRIRDLGGFTIAGYVDDPGIWREYLYPSFRRYVGAPAGFLLLAAGLAAVVLVAGRKRVPRVAAAGAALACAVANLVAYSVTPYSALGPEDAPLLAGVNTRYAMPALVLAAAVGAAAVTALRPWWLRVALLVAAALAIVQGLWVDEADPSAGGWTAAFALTALALAAAWARRRGVVPRVPRYAVVGVAAGALALAVVAGNEMQERFNDGRYAGEDAAIDRLLSEAPRDHRIALAGLWTDDGLSPVHPAFGPRLENEVEYLGRFVDEEFNGYRDRDGFLGALQADGFDYLVVGRGRPPEPFAREERWARSAGWTAIARSDRLALYEQAGDADG